jgi:hypothetical protein
MPTATLEKTEYACCAEAGGPDACEQHKQQAAHGESWYIHYIVHGMGGAE